MNSRTLFILSLLCAAGSLPGCGGSGGGGGDQDPAPLAPKAFTHETDNAFGALTTLDHPDLNGNPMALMIVTPTANAGGIASDLPVSAPIGMLYIAASQRWSIMTEDQSGMKNGEQFQIEPLSDPERAYFHENNEDTSFAIPTATVLDHPLLNGTPIARVFVTQYMNNGSRLDVVRNEDEIAVFYNEINGRWMIHNQTGIPMPLGALFSVYVAPFAESAIHRVSEASRTPGPGNLSVLDHPMARDPNAKFFVTLSSGGSGATIVTRSPTSTFWSPFHEQWLLRNSTDAALPLGTTYFVLAR